MDELENCIKNFNTLETEDSNGNDANYEKNRKILIDKLTNNFDDFAYDESNEKDKKSKYVRRRDIDDKFIGYTFKGNKEKLND